jgi:hypothetical protein
MLLNINDIAHCYFTEAANIAHLIYELGYVISCADNLTEGKSRVSLNFPLANEYRKFKIQIDFIGF